MGFVGSLNEKNASGLAIATGLLIAWAIWNISGVVVDGLLGWVLVKMNVSNDEGSFRLALGSIVQVVLTAGLAVAGMIMLNVMGGDIEKAAVKAASSEKKD